MASDAPQAHVSIELVLDIQQHNFWQRFTGSQAFWVTVALLIICIVMSWLQPASFATADNFYNTTRNFSFIGIMALGMTAVIATGGIDLSVGSIMGLTAVSCGLILEAGYPGLGRWIVGLLAGGVVGLINGIIIAYLGLSPFVTTLGMLAIARSVAVVLSGNRMIYKFGPGGPPFKALGSGAWHHHAEIRTEFSAPLPHCLYVHSGRCLQDDELGSPRAGDRRKRTGRPIDRRSCQSHQGAGLCLLRLTAAFAAILSVGWAGSAINALGATYELLAISAAVIGGANLMGGEASAYGAFIGAALIFVIRNSLLMEGVDSNWQGTFVGLFLIGAVYLGKLRGAKRE